MNQNRIQGDIDGQMYMSSSTLILSRHTQLGHKVIRKRPPIQTHWDVVNQINGGSKVKYMLGEI